MTHIPIDEHKTYVNLTYYKQPVKFNNIYLSLLFYNAY